MEPTAWGILGYVALQLVIGFAIARRVRTEDDYLLAGRSLGPVMTTMSVFATWFGAETVIGSSSAVYEEGLTGAASDPFGYGLCIFLVGALLAVPLSRLKLTTLADLFRIRFSTSVERGAAVLLAPTSLIWAAAQVKAFGHIIDATVPTLDLEMATALAAAVVITYTISGGLFADAVTDLVQGFVLIAGIAIIGVVVVGDVGGLGAALAMVDPEQLQMRYAAEEGGWIATLEGWAVPICGSLVAQELIQRVMAARSPEIARRSCFAASGIYIIVGVVPVLLGLLAVHLLPGADDPEQIMPILAREHLSSFLYVAFVGALVSAILSTVDTALLVAGSLITHNVVIPAMRITDERIKLRVSRIGVLCFGVLAYLFAMSPRFGSVHDMVEMASGLGSAGIFVCTIFGLYSRFGGPRAGLGALTSGLVVYVAGTFFGLTAPFVASLVASLVAYGALGMTEQAPAPA